MDKISIKDLERICETHKVWLQSNGKKGNKADFAGADLSGVSFSGKNLLLANFAGANLSGANLLLADLSQADLSQTNLSGADLSGTDLLLANFSKADLSGADLSVSDLSGADLSEAQLPAASLPQADLSGTNLSGANLSGADLSESDLSGADLSGADLSHAYASKANFSQANLSKANFLLVSCNGAEFNKANLAGLTIDSLTLAQLSPELIHKFKDTFQVIELDKSEGFVIIREINLPETYYQAGLCLLNYFGMFLCQQYPENSLKIKIELHNLTAGMIVETQDESVKNQIEELFEIYGLIVQGKLVCEALSKNKKQVQQLENQFLHVKAMLESEKQLSKDNGIIDLKTDIKWLREHLGRLLQHPESRIKAAKDVISRSMGLLKDIKK